MANQSPSLGTVLQRAIERALREVRTCEPGVINSYDPVTRTADVQPLLMRTRPTEDGTTITVRAPMATACPVLFVGGGGSRLTFPVKAGDVCLLLTGSRSLARWKLLGGEVDPMDNRHHHITDSIALVGLMDMAHGSPAHATATVLEGSDVRLGDANGGALATKADLDALAAYVDKQFGAVGHTHVVSGAATTATNKGSTPSGGAAGVPSAAGTTKVKAT